VEDPGITDGGLVVQDAEGRRVWDNRLPQRLERMWPELRRQIAVRTALVAENAATEGET
jgi:vacuolar-type H+-ATPase subunit E/Vma4